MGTWGGGGIINPPPPQFLSKKIFRRPIPETSCFYQFLIADTQISFFSSKKLVDTLSQNFLDTQYKNDFVFLHYILTKKIKNPTWNNFLVASYELKK